MGIMLAGPETGTGVSDWVFTQLDDTEGQTAEPLRIKIIYVGPNPPSESASSVTDADAQRRFLGRHTSEMAQNLLRLALAAKLVLPGLRDMTEVERGALRHYYRGLYRKA